MWLDCSGSTGYSGPQRPLVKNSMLYTFLVKPEHRPLHNGSPDNTKALLLLLLLVIYCYWSNYDYHGLLRFIIFVDIWHALVSC